MTTAIVGSQRVQSAFPVRWCKRYFGCARTPDDVTFPLAHPNKTERHHGVFEMEIQRHECLSRRGRLTGKFRLKISTSLIKTCKFSFPVLPGVQSGCRVWRRFTVETSRENVAFSLNSRTFSRSTY